MASQIQIRRDTATNWASINPILAQGEFGYVLDSQEFKIKKGDGVTAWNNLPFIEFGDKALWGNIGGDITNQPDLMNYLQNLQDDIDDEVSARASADQTLTNQYNSLNTAVSNIQAVIPNDASSSNQLADKSFVNSSIASSTANFIGTFNSVAEMEAYSGPLTNNDYAFVETTDSAGNTLYDRYKWNGSEWLFEYELNNSSFTADQWASINSNATESKIAQIATNTSNITTLQGQVADKQDTITDLATIRSNATAGKQASDTIATYGNIVTHNVSEFATSAQGTKADTAIQGVQINGTDLTKDVNNKVNIPKAVAGQQTLGVVMVKDIGYGITVRSDGQLTTNPGDWAKYNNATTTPNPWLPIVAKDLLLGMKAFLGTTITSSTSNLTWNDTEKTSACKTIGAVSGVQINGTDLPPDTTTNKVDIPIANTTNKLGLVQTGGTGIGVTAGGLMYTTEVSESQILQKTNQYNPITARRLDYAIKVGVTTNTLTLTDSEKTSARSWLGATRVSFVDWTD